MYNIYLNEALWQVVYRSVCPISGDETHRGSSLGPLGDLELLTEGYTSSAGPLYTPLSPLHLYLNGFVAPMCVLEVFLMVERLV